MNLAIDGVMKIKHNCFVLMNGEKCDGLYHLIENTIINGFSLTLIGRWKQDAQNNKCLHKVSFTVRTETGVNGFKVTDDSEIVHAFRENGLRSFFRVD